jgi:hypothetical protein
MEKAVRMPSGSIFLFQLGISSSSEFEDGEGAPGSYIDDRIAYSISVKERFIKYIGTAAFSI